MMRKTHIAIGAVTTLVLLTDTTLGVLPSIVGMAGCVAPDVDKKIRVKHRGISHSLIIVAVLYILISILNKNIAIAFCINYLLHIIADCLTVMGCPLLFPFSNKNYGLKLFKTNGFIEKIVYIIILLVLISVLYRLL